MKWRKFLKKNPFYWPILMLFGLLFIKLSAELLLSEKTRDLSFIEILYFSVVFASFGFLVSTSVAFMFSVMHYQYDRKLKAKNKNFKTKRHLYSLLFSLLYSLIVLAVGSVSLRMPRKENQYFREEWVYTSIEVFLKDPTWILGLVILSLIIFCGFYFLALISFSDRVYRIEITSLNKDKE